MLIRKNGWGKLFICLMLSLFLGFALITVMPQSATAGTTELTIKKLASDGETVLAEKTVDYRWLMDPENIEVMGNGETHYYHQGPVFIDDLDPDEQERLRWNEEEDTNYLGKDMGAARGTNVRDLCKLVGGMKEGETLQIKAVDGLKKTFAYKNVYEYSEREGPMVVCWETCWDGDVLYPDTGYKDGMRLVWFADDSVNPDGLHVFGNFDWKLAADPEYWYYYQDGSEKYPTTTGLSVKYVSELTIYSNESVPEPKTWYVDGSGSGDFTTIQEAITASGEGDTIVVKDGTYTENVLVDKSLVIRSENGADLTTVQAANEKADVFKVTAENVTIEGFTVSGATSRGMSGISICSPSSSSPNRGSCTVINNKCSGNNQGITLKAGTDNMVTNNTCTLSGNYGIYLNNTTGNFITDNICSKNTSGSGFALYLADNANNNTVNGNISSSNNIGIRVKNAHFNTIFNNTCSNNDHGLEIATKSANNMFYLNNFIDNTSGQLSLGCNAIAGNSWNSLIEMPYSFNGKQYNGFVGNYWGDYTGTDADGNGIGDTPYQTVETDSDNYPLMGQWKDGVIAGSAVATYTVTFVVTPEDATVVVKDSEGNVVAAEEDGTYNLEAVEYSYTVSAEGYVTKSDIFTVTEEGQTINVVLEEEVVEPTTYTVTFVVTPADATVVVKDSEGNVVAAEEDGTYNLEAGEYSYTVSAEGYMEKTGDFTVIEEAQTVTIVLEKVVDPDKPQYNLTPQEDTVYTIGATADGIKTMTVNPNQTGFKFFTVSIEPVVEHEGTEVVVFTHLRDKAQLQINATEADFDKVNTAKAGFNVNPGDVIKVYIMDQLTNDTISNPFVIQ